MEHCDGDHCDGGHYDEENCDWGHCDEEICDGVICDGDNSDGDCYSEHCGDCECENGHCDEQCDVISSEEVSSSSSVGRRAKAEAVCNHTWKTMVSKQPGCTTAGVYVTRCTKCGAYAQNGKGYIAPLGHKWKRIVTKQPTCTMPGTYVNKCERCNMSTTGTISALGHALSWKYKTAPTETMPGVEENSCNRCGYVANVRYIPPLGNGSTSTSVGRTVLVRPACAYNKHVWKTYTTKEPTCTTSGTYITKCSVCGAGSPNGNGYIPALGHKWNRTAPSCTQDRKCDRCGTVDKPRLGHSYAWRTKVNATCTADGSKERYCTRSGCGYVVERQTIKALGHSWDSGTVTKAATCTATGTKTFKCTRCSATTTEEIPKAAHNCEWRVTVQPSCKGSGTEQYTCKVCGTGTAWRSIQYYGDHTWVAATCTKAKTCSVCGATSGSALGHAWDNGTVTKAATHSATGVKTFKCTRSGCGATKTETIPVIAHSYTWVVTTPSTCTKEGVESYKCSCGYVSQTRSVAKKAHNGVWAMTVQPSCAGSGTEECTCKDCGAWLGARSIQYYGGHTWDRTAATCTAAQKCTVCGTIGQEALGHAWDNGTVTKGASHSATGVKTFKCTRTGCTATKTETIPVIAHSYTWVVTTPSTCTKEGVESYKCSCGYVSQTRPVAKKAHNGVWATTVQPSCAGSGTEECTCKDCGAWLGARSIQYYGDHTWDRNEADCVHEKRCTICGIVGQEKLEHTYAWRTTDEPSCTKVGYRERFCTGCGKIISRQEIPANGHSWDIEIAEITCERGQVCTECGVTGAGPKAHDYELQTYLDTDNVSVLKYACKECQKVFSEKRIRGAGGNEYTLSLISVSSGLPDIVTIILNSLEIPEGYELIGFSLDPEAKDLPDVPETAVILTLGSGTFTCYAVVKPIIKKETYLTFYYDATGMLWEKYEGKNGETVRWQRKDVETVKSGTIELTAQSDNLVYSISKLPEWFHVTKDKQFTDSRTLYFGCDPCYDIMDEFETKKTRVAEITIVSSEGELVCLRVVQYRPVDFGGSSMLSREKHEREYNQYVYTTSNKCVSMRSFFNLDGKDRKAAIADNRKDLYIFHREYAFSPIQSESSIGGHYLTTLSNYDKLYLSIDVSYSRFSLHEDNSSDGVVKQKEFYFTEELRHGLGGATKIKLNIYDEDLSTALLSNYVRYSIGGFSQLPDGLDDVLNNYHAVKDIAGIVIDVFSLVDGDNKIIKAYAVVLSGAEFVETIVDGEWNLDDLESGGSLALSLIDLLGPDLPTPIDVINTGLTIYDIGARVYDLHEIISEYGLVETQTCKILRSVENNIVFESIEKSRVNLSDGLNTYVTYYDTPASSHVWHAAYTITAYGETYSLEWVNGEPIIH